MHGCIKHYIRVERKLFASLNQCTKHTHHVSLAIDGGACLIGRERRGKKRINIQHEKTVEDDGAKTVKIYLA